MIDGLARRVLTPAHGLLLAALLLAAGCNGGSSGGGLGGIAGVPSRTPTADPANATATATPPLTSPVPASPPPTITATARPVPSPSATVSPTETARSCDDPSAAARLRPSVVRIEAGGGMGTGMVAGPNLILTAEHVVSDVRNVELTLADGRLVSADVVLRRPDLDLALLRAALPGLPKVGWGDEGALRPGQPLLALGYARDIPGEPSLTGGRFSARRQDGGVTLIQTDTALNPGNSGGPLFNQCGEVVGIVSFRLADAQGISFAVAGSHARALINGPIPSAAPAPTSAPTPAPTPRAATPPPQTAATATPTPTTRSIVVVKQYGAAVRASPSSDAPIIAMAPCGARLGVLGAQSGWTRVALDGQREGWMGDFRIADAANPPAFDCSSAVTFRPNDAVVTRVQTGCLSLRDQPSRSGAILRCVENGTRYTIVNGPIEVNGEDWFQVTNPTLGTGWVLAQFLLPGR